MSRLLEHCFELGQSGLILVGDASNVLELADNDIGMFDVCFYSGLHSSQSLVGIFLFGISPVQSSAGFNLDFHVLW